MSITGDSAPRSVALRNGSVWAALGVGLCHWLYSYAQCAAVWRALVRQVRAKTEWQKTSRVAEANRVGVDVGPRPDARTI